MSSGDKKGQRLVAGSAIFLAFVVAMEIVIMISPFALFFYSVFNPFLIALDKTFLTRWLTAFFLPHMVIPSSQVLIIIRILGSIFFVAGLAIFLICAVQVYAGKLLKAGASTKGFYAIIRHPQYVALALAALGLAIMWPRFLTLALLAIMLFLYYLLARDEERRMTNRFGDSYRDYVNRTGMFLPRLVERIYTGKTEPQKHLSPLRGTGMLLILLTVILGSGFVLRAYTIRHLPLEQIGNIDVITITKGDLETARELLPSIVQDSAVSAKLKSMPSGNGYRLLAYFIPIDYVMQGMIANTGEEWKLFQQHKTIGMITEYILHPFAHLTAGHTHHMSGQVHDISMHNSPAMRRRIIFVALSADNRTLMSPFDDFGINVERNPLFFVDMHIHTEEILKLQDTPPGSGWGTVPTPMF